METGSRCGVSREPGESQMRLGASLFLREGKKRARLCCAGGGGLKSANQVGGGTFLREDRNILRDVEKKCISRNFLI